MNKQALNVLGLLSTMFALAIVALPARAADTVVYYHTDALHSVSVVTDAQGQVLERTHYAPYGQVLNRPLRDGPGYTGHREDAATGLVYMQQRYYDPDVGRFLSVDPVEVDAGTGGNFNRYWYANDNPYRYIDPDGRCADGTCDQMVQAYAKYANEHPSTELSPLAKVGLTVMLTASSVDEVAIAGKAISSVVKVLRVAKVASNVAKANKISHIFSQERHNLAGVAKALGGESKALKAIENATGKAVDTSKPGRFETTVKVGGEHVTVRGSVVDGKVKIGTAFVKKKLEQ